MRRPDVPQQGIVEHLYANRADADQPALRRQHDTQRVGPGAADGQKRRRGRKHAVEDQGHRVDADLLPDHVANAQGGDGEHEKAGLDPTADGVVERVWRIRPGHCHRSCLVVRF